jgi:hypothetical protein
MVPGRLLSALEASGTYSFPSSIKNFGHVYPFSVVNLHSSNSRNKTAPFEERWLYNTNYYTRVFNDPTYWKDYDESVRCGRDNMNHANQTAVIDINAGDAIEIAHQRSEPGVWTPAYFEGCPGGRATCDPTGSLVSQ